MRALRTLIATTAASAGILTLGGLSAGASASGGDCLDMRGAVGCFYAHGDIVVVHDSSSDGKKPEVQWETDYGRGGTCRWRGDDYWTDCNYDLREDSYISFRVVQRSTGSGDIVDASGWAREYVGR